jgi:hypothetical protein
MLAGLTAGGEARAGGFFIPTITTQQTGDPTYEYIITVELLAGSTLMPGGFFTVYDLPGLPLDALNKAPNIFWGFSAQFVGINPPTDPQPAPDDPTIVNATWKWLGATNITAPADSNLLIGPFIVGSTSELPSPPTNLVYYLGSLDGNTEANLSTVVINAVPEPASIILLATAAVFALSANARVLRRRPRPAAPAV